ncbi:hypothetical protein BJ166DRAFT_617175 [Pestalotiopsis sp. NC0098]|nr:hypothetical protein BJ166DRAFT_617175 [Pestalotiopsis sp. NC0098]
MTEVNPETQGFPIWISFTGDSKPMVFDLSGAIPFELYVNARRNAVDETDPRDLVLLKTGSVFEFPAALNTGILELVDEATGVVVISNDDTAHIRAEKAVSESLDNNTFITLPTDIKKRDRPIQSIPLNAASCLRSMVQPERFYHLRLRNKNLGVRWWTWGERPIPCSNMNELSPSERQTIISVGTPRSKSFTVKSEIPIPTPLFISLSLADQATIDELGSDDKASPPTINITITNTSDLAIVLKTIGDQPHLKKPSEITNPQARVMHERPALQNFSVVDQGTKEDLISNLPLFTSPAPGRRRALGQSQFLALAPQEQVARTAELPGQRLIPGREYHVTLRSTGCWWTYGTLDDLFGEGIGMMETLPPGLKVPMPLESVDMVVVICQ